MKDSPVYPKYDHQDYQSYEFDPYADFAQFLSEAREHKHEVILSTTPPLNHEKTELKKADDAAEKKPRSKSWKRSLFSWLKREKKKNDKNEEKTSSKNSNGVTISKPRRGSVSGPVQGVLAARTRKPISGPIASLFTGVDREESDFPYMCLEKMHRPEDVQSYGPVYLVT